MPSLGASNPLPSLEGLVFLPFTLRDQAVLSQPLKVVIHQRQHQNQFFEEELAAGVALRMMSIPEGEFLMGSPEDEIDRWGDESPQHPVRLTTPPVETGGF